MVIEANIYTIKEIDLPEVNIQRKSNDIVYVLFKDNCTLDIDLQMRLLDQYNKIAENKLMPFIFMAAKNVSITKEARDNAVKIEDISMIGSSAVIVTSLPYKLIANFYLRFNKPKRPFKVFSNEEEAVKWLKTMTL
jgi:hypothetical protein